MDEATLTRPRTVSTISYSLTPARRIESVRYAARQRSRLSLLVVLHTIGVPFLVTPVAPAVEQNEPGWTTDGFAEEQASARVVRAWAREAQAWEREAQAWERAAQAWARAVRAWAQPERTVR